MSNSLALQDFLSSFLTSRQKTLLAHQKSRVALLNASDLASKRGKLADVLGDFDKLRFE